MRMDFFFGNFFWGILVILLGLSIFLRGFNINLPLLKVFFAVMIIMFGIRILIGSGSSKPKSSGIHYQKGTSQHYSRNRTEYSFVFSGGTLDLTGIKPDAKDLEITVVFGTATVILPSDIKFDIEPTTVFGATYLPGNSYVGFGEDNLILNPENAAKPINIESSAVFGRVEYIIKDRPQKATEPSAKPDSLNPGSEF